MNEEMLHIPVTGYMTEGADGEYHLNPEKSEYADISADFVARFLIQRFGLTPWKKEDSNE